MLESCLHEYLYKHQSFPCNNILRDKFAKRNTYKYTSKYGAYEIHTCYIYLVISIPWSALYARCAYTNKKQAIGS